MDQLRIWEIFTGQKDYVASYKYQVSVSVKGTLFSSGMSWTGPMVDGQGNGPMMIHVPRQDEAGVVSRRMTPRELALDMVSVKPVQQTTPTAPKPPASTPVVSGPQAPGSKPPAPATKTPPGAKPATASRTVLGYDIGLVLAPPGETASGSGEKKSKLPEKTTNSLKRLTGDQGWVNL